MSSSEDMRRMAAYREFRQYMQRAYGPGPWGPGRRPENDGWLAWCRSYDLDPLTALPFRAGGVKTNIPKEAAS